MDQALGTRNCVGNVRRGTVQLVEINGLTALQLVGVRTGDGVQVPGRPNAIANIQAAGRSRCRADGGGRQVDHVVLARGWRINLITHLEAELLTDVRRRISQSIAIGGVHEIRAAGSAERRRRIGVTIRDKPGLHRAHRNRHG